MKIETKVDGAGGAEQQTVECKSCGARWQMGERMLIGEVLECGECQATLEVANLAPIELVPFRMIEESEDDFVNFDLL